MAKIVISIEDTPDGKVKVDCNPTFETMMAMDLSSPGSITSAHGYAFKMINEVLRVSKQNGPIIREIPRLIS